MSKTKSIVELLYAVVSLGTLVDPPKITIHAAFENEEEAKKWIGKGGGFKLAGLTPEIKQFRLYRAVAEEEPFTVITL
jgi:hypothetical protein